jgi:ribonuclease HII
VKDPNPNTISKISERKSQKKGASYPFPWELIQPQPIIGVDEVGRGCLAGRVYAAAVIWPVDLRISGVTDSKLLSENRRDELSKQIRASVQVSLGFAEVEEIDSLNILQASLLAMRRAVLGLGVSMGHVLVDGHQRIPLLSQQVPGLQQTTVIKGDLRALPIGAASIVAKVARDQEMKDLALLYPEYGFEKHKGYASELHRRAIQMRGPCQHHRKTFAGVKEYL